MNSSRLPHLLLLAAATVASFGCESKNRSPMELAEYYFSRPDYPKALEVCDNALKACDEALDQVEEALDQVDAALDQVATEKARADFLKEKADLLKKKADFLAIKGRCYLGQGHEAKNHDEAQQLFRQAIGEFTKALELDSKHLDALHNRLKAYRYTNQEELASDDYALIRKLDPNYQTAYQRERDTDPHIPPRKGRPIESEIDDEPEATNSDEPLVAEEPPAVKPDKEDENEQGDQSEQVAVDTSGAASGRKPPGPQISVSDFEPSVPNPGNQFSQWLSQHQLDPSLGRQPATLPPSSLEQGLGVLHPNLDDESEGESDESDRPEDNEDATERPSSVPSSPAQWPSPSQWPQFPTPPDPTLPTGVVGPALHPPTSVSPPTSPYRGMVSPTGSTGVGGELLTNRTVPYAAQPTPYSSQTLPTTGITGTFPPYGSPGSSLGPYRQTLPDSMRQPTPHDPSSSRTDSRIPHSLLPGAPKLPTAPRPRFQYQTSPLSTPTIQPNAQRPQ